MGIYLPSSALPTSTGPPPIIGAFAEGPSFAPLLGTTGVGAGRWGKVKRGRGNTGISLGGAAFGAAFGAVFGAGLGFGFGFTAALGRLGAVAFGAITGAGAVSISAGAVAAEESTSPGCDEGTTGVADVLGVIAGTTG